MALVLMVMIIILTPFELQIFFVAMATSVSVFNMQLSTPFLGLFEVSQDYISSALISLTLLTSFVMQVAWGSGALVKLKTPVAFLILLTLFLLTGVFLVKNILSFYILFEISMLPVMLMIYGWGFQPERMKASVYLMFYTVMASLPLLLLILFLGQQTTTFFQAVLLSAPSLGGVALNTQMFMMTLCFLVKFPMYLLHLWLPKAHVEAPVSGSIVLAAILLKLGGYGMIRFIVFIVVSPLTGFAQVLSLLGGALIGVLCLSQKDLKILIAYSSVSHMAMVISSIFTKTSTAIAGSVLLMIAHGLASSGMFAVANLSYERSHSRNFLLNMGTLSVAPLLSMFWFMVSLANMGGPPSLNLLSEILLIFALVKSNIFLSSGVTLIAFLSVAYGLILYSVTSQTKNTEISFFLAPLSSREVGLMTLHVIYLNVSVCLGYLICV